MARHGPGTVNGFFQHISVHITQFVLRKYVISYALARWVRDVFWVAFSLYSLGPWWKRIWSDIKCRLRWQKTANIGMTWAKPAHYEVKRRKGEKEIHHWCHSTFRAMSDIGVLISPRRTTLTPGRSFSIKCEPFCSDNTDDKIDSIGSRNAVHAIQTDHALLTYM